MNSLSDDTQRSDENQVSDASINPEINGAEEYSTSESIPPKCDETLGSEKGLEVSTGSGSQRSSKSSSPDPDLSDIKPANINDSSYNIMSVCSTAAQHIRQTISEVLSSRLDATSSSVTIEEVPNSLEESLKQKLEDFENTVKNNISLLPAQEKEATPPPEVRHNSSSSTKRENISQEREVASPVPLVQGESSDGRPSPINNEKKPSKSRTDYAAKPGKNSFPRKSSTGSLKSMESNENDSLESSPSMMCNGTAEPTENRVPPINNHIVEERYSKKSNRNSTNKKKGERSVDYILKSLSSLPSTEEKLQALGRKHSEVLDDLKCTELRSKQNEKQVIQLAKEKEQLQAEHNRMILAKSKLESLCRELQRQNKAVKEESLLRIREEEEKRKEVASKFQTTLNEISSLMQENSKKNLQLKQENTELAQKLKTLVEHYEMWEKHMEKVVQQKDLEAQLAKAKHAKTNLQLKQETEKFLREKQSLLENMSELQKKCTYLASNELQLRAELNDYTSKYEEFQTVLNKSNQVFASFKSDMETTSKKIKKLEKETNLWKQKWESSNNALVEMITDKQKRDKELINAQQRILTLEKLCRALQAERNDLQNKLSGGEQQQQDCAIDNESAEVLDSSKEVC